MNIISSGTVGEVVWGNQFRDATSEAMPCPIKMQCTKEAVLMTAKPGIQLAEVNGELHSFVISTFAKTSGRCWQQQQQQISLEGREQLAAQLSMKGWCVVALATAATLLTVMKSQTRLSKITHWQTGSSSSSPVLELLQSKSGNPQFQFERACTTWT